VLSTAKKQSAMVAFLCLVGLIAALADARSIPVLATTKKRVIYLIGFFVFRFASGTLGIVGSKRALGLLIIALPKAGNPTKEIG